MVQAELMRVRLEDCDVEFEDVKFLRATHLQKNQGIELRVIIHKGSGKFEIIEGTNAVVTGTVRPLASKMTEFDVPADPNCATLEQRDFYKELRLRGYHYKDLFRSVMNARANGTGGRIKWASNWVALLDCLLQINIVARDTRQLMIPTAIRKILIKPREHLATFEGVPEEERFVDVKMNKQLMTLRSPGIEMRGLEATCISRRRPPGIPVLESYQFMPYLSGMSISKIDAARCCVQLALENLPCAKVVVVEIDSYDEREPLSDYFGQALGDLPLVTGEMNYLTTRTVEIEGKVEVQDCALSTFSNVSFVIKSNALTDQTFLEGAIGQIKEGGIVVSREKSSSSIHNHSLPPGYKFIAIITSDDEAFVLLQYFPPKPKVEGETPEVPTKYVRVTNKNYDWIDTLKQDIKDGPVVAFAENEQFCGIIGLVNCIRKEPNGLNLRCVFIDDVRAPPFDESNNFYKSQLAQGMAINVFKHGRWGCYRHVLLEQENEVKPRKEHCYANSLVRGDLSSMTWMHGPFNSSKPSDNVVQVQYASLNFRDVMLATGKITSEIFGSGRLDQLCVLGLEYSGVTKDNKRVMGMLLSAAMATHLEPDMGLLWEVPEFWTLEEAATIPVVYGTVYAAFFTTIQIETGKKILIHAGSGGVGLAAIRVAFAYGLEVFTTVSTEEKKNYLLSEFPQLKAEHIGNSRDISFEDMVMTQTNGKGVDYVLNSLAGDKLHASIRCLGKGGKFLEIGKFDITNDTKIGLSCFIKELSFHAVLVDNVFTAVGNEKAVSSGNLLEEDQFLVEHSSF